MSDAPSTLTSPHALVLDDLKKRGLFYQCTDEAGLREHLAQPRTLYNGFDPTADSFTIGNLVAISILRRLQTFGHTPIVLMGGATGRIGDPSGKDTERTLMTDETIEGNLVAQRKIFEQLLRFEGENGATIVNNHDWFKDIDVYFFLREIGKHFSVNQMLARDAVKNRIEREGQGISYTEFSYMLLQAYDFLHLFREMNVTIQTAGSDQWGNIASGVNLIRRDEFPDYAHEIQAEQDRVKRETGKLRPVPHEEFVTPAFGLTAPLLTKSDGGKFGKTESGAIWLSHNRPSGQPGTSPYAYYQFWLNAADEDVEKFLKIFTDLPVDDENAEALKAAGQAVDDRTIESIIEAHRAEPHRREAQRT
ncbi:MAG: tyrosine--tRNA ligase, partial [Planctomycetota bacterium]